jgi:hypothetical protein
MACLTPLGIDKLKEMLSTNGTKLSQLARMETVARKAKITEAMGKENTDYINYEIEKRLISKTTKPLMNWVEREVTAPKQRADILKRVGKLVASIKDENSLKLLTNKKSRDALLEDLIAHKLGVGVTQEETATIMDLALNADTARKEITEVANAKTDYGKAYSLMARNVDEAQALKDAGITKAQYDKITEQRITAGTEIAKYMDYMDKLKQDAGALKKEDFTRDKSWWETYKKISSEVFNSVRSVMASGELGFIFRQGLKTLYYDPKTWGRNSLEAIQNAGKSFKNINFKATVMAEIMTRPNYLSGHYAEAKLAINTIEDYYQNSWIERIVAGDRPNFLQTAGQVYKKFSEDTYLTFMFKTRADLFDAHWEKLQDAGVGYEGMGEFFNNLTGRGTGVIGGKGNKKGFGEYFMFAPKYTQSQMNSFTKMFSEKNPTLRMEYFKNTASLLAGTATILALGALFGFEPELDPRSTKFGRIVFPNGYVMDITGGLTTYTALVSRIATGKSKSGKGKVYELGGYGRDNATDLILRFLTSKGSPQVSIFTSMMNRELFGGKEITPASFTASLAPIFGQEAYDDLTDENIEAFEKLMLVSGAFFGLSSWHPDNFKKGRKRK